MAYSAWSVVFGEQPSAAKWNILGTNDASFNDGTGIASLAITTAKLNTGAVTSVKQTAHYYQANVATAGAVTSASFANFPTNRCKVDVATSNVNALVLISFSATGAYAGATGSCYLRFNMSGANSGTSTYTRRGQNSDSGQEVPMAYQEVVTLATAGTTTVEMQIAGSAASSCNASNVILNAVVLQDKG